jgi:hypothetical protein
MIWGKLMKRSATLLAIALIFAFMLQPATGKGPKKPPLPALPDQSVIDAVVAATDGAVFTPLYLSSSLQNRFSNFGGVFSGVTLDTSRAVHYITTGGDLLETLVPVAGLGSATLAPNMMTPGGQSKPGLIIGAWFQPPSDERFIVLTFKANGDPDKIRFYRPNNNFVEGGLEKGTFNDHHNDHQIEPVDEGAVISDKRSCITVGLHQVCWAPAKHEEIRDETKPSKRVKNAASAFDDLYDVGVDFDDKNAVPDLLGKAEREACAAHLASATAFDDMVSCKANLVIATAKGSPDPDQPMALLVLSAPADIRTYDTAGNFVGALPAGKYLVLATPTVDTDAGTPTALFLVGLNGNNYLIASTIMQGFGDGAIGNTGQAGIRDGFVRYRCFGW